MTARNRITGLGPATIRDATEAEKAGPVLTTAASPTGRPEPAPKLYEGIEGVILDEPATFAPVDEWNAYIARLETMSAPAHMIRTAQAWRDSLVELELP